MHFGPKFVHAVTFACLHCSKLAKSFAKLSGVIYQLGMLGGCQPKTSIIQSPKKLVDQSRAVEHDAQLNIASKILQGEEKRNRSTYMILIYIGQNLLTKFVGCPGLLG